MVKINPTRIPGLWKQGYALDQHTLSSILLGYNEWGHAQYETTRTEIGELMYRLKYRGNQGVIPEIVETAVGFVKSKDWPVACLVPVPPSNLARACQPVWLLGQAIAQRLGINYCQAGLVKIRETPQLKDTFDPAMRAQALEGALKATADVRSKVVLLFDDLISSGTTLRAAAVALTQGGATSVYALTLTRTRTAR